MMFYGNEYRTLSGVIKEVQTQMLKIQFDMDYSHDRIVAVPKSIIKSEVKFEKDLSQDFKIPTWYLKRNRIVPLNEHLHQ